MNRVRIQIIVPTLRRVKFLKLCLESILKQSVKVDRIFVGVRSDDEESAALIDALADHNVIERVDAKGVGVIGSMASCLSVADGDYIALVDDDVELPPGWLETMLAHLEANPDVVGCAGRDLLQDHPEMRREEPLSLDVGRVHWYGRISGNHHRGGGHARHVDVLRGSNILFRAGFLKEVGFEHRLRGAGAQVNWELALAFQAASRKRRLMFDPMVEVIHHTAPRQGSDHVHRGIFNAGAIKDMSYNETYISARHAPTAKKITLLAWQFLVGTKAAPGLLNALRTMRIDPAITLARLKAATVGRSKALMASMVNP